MVQFKFISTLLFLLVTFAQNVRGQTCDCLSCPDRTTVPANAQSQISNRAPCPAGKAAAVSAINIQSTDGSGFQVYTMDDPNETSYYTAGSTTSTVTCFKMGRSLIVGGQKPQIYVVIKCQNGIKSCSLKYSISLNCVNLATTSTIRSTPASTAKPVEPTTVAPMAIVDTCQCHCCKGSTTCAPVYVGTVPYYNNTCAPSDCANRCSSQLFACPIEGVQSGNIQTYCRSNTGLTLRNVFCVPLLILFLFIFNI